MGGANIWKLPGNVTENNLVSDQVFAKVWLLIFTMVLCTFDVHFVFTLWESKILYN